MSWFFPSGGRSIGASACQQAEVLFTQSSRLTFLKCSPPYSCAPENMAAAAFAVPRGVQLRVFTERLLRGGVRELLRPRLSGRTPGSERDFSLSHSRVRAGSESWGSLPLVELVMAEACFEKRAETGWAPNQGWWALLEVPAASGGGSPSLPRPPGHGHCRALVEGAASGRRPETAPAPATPRLQARGRYETPAQRKPAKLPLWRMPHAQRGRLGCSGRVLGVSHQGGDVQAWPSVMVRAQRPCPQLQ